MANFPWENVELYSRETVITDAVLDGFGGLSVMAYPDDESTVEELSGAVDTPPEVIKCGKPALLKCLYELLCLYLGRGSVPQDMHDANIVTLYKNKGDHSDCNNYRGVCLLNIL